MRLLIVILVLGSLVIVDQFKYHGYYGRQFSYFVVRVMSAMT